MGPHKPYTVYFFRSHRRSQRHGKAPCIQKTRRYSTVQFMFRTSSDCFKLHRYIISRPGDHLICSNNICGRLGSVAFFLWFKPVSFWLYPDFSARTPIKLPPRRSSSPIPPSNFIPLVNPRERKNEENSTRPLNFNIPHSADTRLALVVPKPRIIYITVGSKSSNLSKFGQLIEH